MQVALPLQQLRNLLDGQTRVQEATGLNTIYHLIRSYKNADPTNTYLDPMPFPNGPLVGNEEPLLVSVTEHGVPRINRLVSESAVLNAVPIELVLYGTGFLVSYSGPPFPKDTRLPGAKLAIATRATFCGLGSSTFEDLMDALFVFDQYGAAHFDSYKKLEIGDFNGHRCILSICKIFTPEAQARGSASIDISQDLDPDGILKKKMESAPGKWEKIGSVLHLPDNQIEYFKQVEHALNGEITEVLIPAKPNDFVVGNLVEFGISIAYVLDSRDHSYSMKVVLRSLNKISDKRYKLATVDHAANNNTRGRKRIRPFLSVDEHREYKLAKRVEDLTINVVANAATLNGTIEEGELNNVDAGLFDLVDL